MSLAEERRWAAAVRMDPGTKLKPMVRRKGTVVTAAPLQVDVGATGVPVPATNLTGGALSAGQVVWVDLPGHGRVHVAAVATN